MGNKFVYDVFASAKKDNPICFERLSSTEDVVFDQEDYQDSYYIDKRMNMALVGLACRNPKSTCFCTSVGDGYLSFTVKRYPTGVVTTALHNLEEGTQIGVRGPYGNYYPVEELEGENVLIVGGGLPLQL